MSGSGLSVSDVVDVTVSLSPLPLAQRNFGTVMIIGPTEGVINTGERFRQYSTITQVQADFGTTNPEAIAAALFFAQTPQPSLCYIGRWAQSATHGWLLGATRSATQQSMTTWDAITNGSFTISIDGTPHAVSGLNFSTATNMNGVASIIQAGLPAGSTCTWDAAYSRLKVRGIATGTSGSVSYATTAGSGTDISALSGLSQAAGASAPVAGIAAETPLAAVTALANASNSWYACGFAPVQASDITDQQYEDVATFIEAESPSRIFAITTQSAAVADPTQTGDLASVLQDLTLQHTMVQYSSSSPYAVFSLLGRFATVDFTANNAVITGKFKQEPGVVAETLSETQAQALTNKNCNVYVNYANSTTGFTPIIQQGVMSGGFFIDERQGLDWLQNNVQTRLFNILFTSPTKIPMTDPGTHILATGVEAAMIDGINNGLIAPGQWNSSAVFGQLKPFQFLDRGYYVFTPSVNTMSEEQRSARIAPTIQAAAKMAGAVHFSNVAISVNR
jgi:hypothetical protein